MPRFLYTLLFSLLLPLVFLRLFYKGFRQRGYWSHWGERLGFYKHPHPEKCLWLHAVSVGEIHGAAPLIESLLAAFPTHTLLLTAMTATGRDTAKALYSEASRVLFAYLPYDIPSAALRFYRHFSPQMGIFMETEVWPNLLAQGEKRGIPLFLVNARLSARSMRGYRRWIALTRPAFAAFSGVAAQSIADAKRLSLLGAKSVSVCGNLKFDVVPNAEKLLLGEDWRRYWAETKRPVFLAASTRDGEENLILSAWQTRKTKALLVLVPRHPDRFSTVAALIEEKGFSYERRSEKLPSTDCDVWLGDSMGEMAAYYRFADVAFIGGTLLPFGGQNLIEAAALGCPVLLGDSTFNFAEAANNALNAGAAKCVTNAADLRETAETLLFDTATRQKMATAAKKFATDHRGATAKTLTVLGL